MEISARELRDLEIAEAFRGYNRDIVNDLLERAAATIEAANERLREMQDRLNNVQSEAGRGRETEDILHRTLLLAQRAADEAVAEAQEKARQMVEEADLKSRKMVADAESEARRRSESERRRLEEEVLDFAGRRDALLNDVEALTRFETDYRERMVRALEADLAALRTRPSAAPGPRPEAHDIEIPKPPSEQPATSDRENSDRVNSDRENSDRETRQVDVAAMLQQALPPKPAAQTSPPSAPTAPAPPAPAAQTQTSPPSAPQAIAAPPAPVAKTPPVDEKPNGSNAIDLLGDDAPEAEVLDDDAFFATLREAVHDETPLGPREDDDEGRLSFFEDENDDRASFRDVFRRRR